MNSTVWVTSDTHFGHANMLNWGAQGRPEFRSVEEMNEIIIERWNKVVRPGDKVYHLGDVFFGDKEWFKQNWPRLNGSKRLIVGNHDDVKFLSSGSFFKKVMLWRYFKEFSLLLTHVPVHPDHMVQKTEKETLNVHGHIHRRVSPMGSYRNVCVEETNYTPVNIEELIQ
jgi:calcineurin-like phosphoesterase family protein